MIRPSLVCLGLIAFAFCGCDNRTPDAKRWDQIAQDLKTDKGIQPFHQARDTWSSAEYHTGLAW